MSHIKIKQDVITISGKRTTSEIKADLKERTSSPRIKFLNLITLSLQECSTLQIPSHMIGLIIRFCSFSANELRIGGQGLIEVDMANNNLTKMPSFESRVLRKLNVENNMIRSLEDMQVSRVPALELLNIKQNPIEKLNIQLLLAPNLALEHQLLEYVDKHWLKQLTHRKVCNIQYIISECLYLIEPQKLIDICETLLEYENTFLLERLHPYLTEELLREIFECSRRNKKRAIMTYFVQKDIFAKLVTLQEKLTALNVQILTEKELESINLPQIAQLLKENKYSKPKMTAFLERLFQLKQLITCQQDLLQLMEVSCSETQPYEADLLVQHGHYFQTYAFTDRNILGYLLKLQSIKLLTFLLEFADFKSQIFHQEVFKQCLKPSSNLYKILLKESRKYVQHKIDRKCFYFGEYKGYQEFVMVNDMYDYQALKSYEEMHNSFSRKNLEIEVRYSNKENTFSVAKKIDMALRNRNKQNLWEEKHSNKGALRIIQRA